MVTFRDVPKGGEFAYSYGEPYKVDGSQLMPLSQSQKQLTTLQDSRTASAPISTCHLL